MPPKMLLDHFYGSLDPVFLYREANFKEEILQILITTIFLSDNFYKIKEDLPPEQDQIKRFFDISSKLPLEMQSHLIHLMYKQKRSTPPTSHEVDHHLKENLSSFFPETELDNLLS
jgi:hypothetical protein